MHPRSAAVPEPVEPTPVLAGPDRAQSDRARLKAMFDAHHNLVWRTLRRYGLDAEAAADVGQQAFLVAVERIADIWLGSERAFLIGTALRLARSSRRSAARLEPQGQLDDRVLQRGLAESQAMTLQLLDRVLSKMDRSLVEVFVLFDVEGFSATEIARALDLPAGTVASRVRRAREEFRAATARLERVFERERGR
ncbi:MAG TPA: sigma-70 family RNA polymerase sigma factor [Polyangiales bacterium]|nr:sigma-70 family RNA polymerase sigma factor [Polyangiales bacterium]